MSENLESLIDSLRITEINELIKECELYAIQNVRLKTILENSFDQQLEVISSNLELIKQKQTIASDSDALLDLLTETREVLEAGHTEFHQILGFEKSTVKALLNTFDKLSELIRINIEQEIQSVEELLNKMGDLDKKNAEDLLSEDHLDIIYIIDEAEKFSKRFIEAFVILQSRVREAFPVDLDNHLLESLASPGGVQMDRFNSDSLIKLFNSELVRYLNISLSSDQ